MSFVLANDRLFDSYLAPIWMELDADAPGIFRGYKAGGSVGPFDQAEMGFEIILDADSLVGFDPIQVGMQDRYWGVEGLEKVVSW